MSHLLRVTPPSWECHIHIGRNLLVLPDDLEDHRVVLSTEERYGKQIAGHLRAPLILLPSGESLKTRKQKEIIEDQLLDMGCSRKTRLIAVGGGTLLDLIGFVAATYCRGVPYTSFPTTLLAMTDASIGGKTGVNLPGAKNGIGAFHLPEAIYIDLDWLKTLPSREILYGLAETIKHGLIWSASLLELVEKNIDDLLTLQSPLIDEVVHASCRVKQEVVRSDPFDRTGIRALLNFGHTVGHALESASSYTLPHGLAVGYGMQLETRLSIAAGLLEKKSGDRILELLSYLYPLNAPWDVERLMTLMGTDKKCKGGKVYFVALEEIGKAKLIHLTSELLHHALRNP